MSNITIVDLCANGHDRSVVGVYKIRGYRACKVCHRASIARSSARKMALRDHHERLVGDEITRFLSKIERTSSGCWVWTGALQNMGYGVVQVAGKLRLAHRVSVRTFRGNIPEGLVLDHLCRNKPCVNPDHLEAVTQRENIARGDAPAAKSVRSDRCKRGHSDWRNYPSGRRCAPCDAIRKSRATEGMSA